MKGGQGGEREWEEKGRGRRRGWQEDKHEDCLSGWGGFGCSSGCFGRRERRKDSRLPEVLSCW